MKRSLHIGINNYPGTSNDLSGCVNDANDWLKALDERGFSTGLMLDAEATKSSMQEAIARIVDETGQNDIGVITYSGHGTWIPDEDNDEPDGRDEALCPYDINLGEVLTDDELYAIFSQRKRGARIIFISDSCHSGSVSRFAGMMPGAEEDPWKFQRIRFLPPEVYLKKDQERLMRAMRVEKIAHTRKRIKAASLLISGCMDSEYSYDAWFNGRANGAFTYVGLQTLKTLPSTATYQDWFNRIREILPHQNYPQTPQLSGSYSQRTKWMVFSE